MTDADELIGGQLGRIAAALEEVVKENKHSDSITIGTPGKGGEQKITFCIDDPMEVITARIDKYFEVRKYANKVYKEAQTASGISDEKAAKPDKL